MVTGKVTAEPRFSDWYARPRYASWYAQNAMAQAMQVQAGAIRYLFEQYARVRVLLTRKSGAVG